MKNNLKLWQFGGFVFTSVLGTLLHFAYEWSGNLPLLAPFAAVNESIFEHIKLLYFPALIFSVAQWFFGGKDFNNFWCAKLIGAIVGIIIIPTLYYTYTGALGEFADWFNIAIFFIAAGGTYLTEYFILKGNKSRFNEGLCLALLLVIGCVFITLTYLPPHIPFFADPVTGKYGI